MNNSNYQGLEELELIDSNLKNYTNYVVNLICKSFPLQNQSKLKILDFGAGTGTLAQLISEKLNVSVDCLEIDSNLGTIIKSKKLRLINNIQMADNYDVIYSSNVLEHIEDDQSILKDLYQVLNPGGSLILYLPANKMLFSDLDTKVGHYRRYNPRDLKKKLFKASFTDIRIMYVDKLGFFAALLTKWFGYNSKSGLGSPITLKIFDKLLLPISKVLDFSTKFKLFGKNILAVSNKEKK